MPRTLWLLSLLALLTVSLVLSGPATAQDADGFKSLFDGKTLEGWDGKAEFWSVKDGAITGQTTRENPTRGNTFIVWKGGDVADFELHLKFKIVGGNSGIQYRSARNANDPYVVGGYQADFDATNQYSGMLYEERGRGFVCPRSKVVTIAEDGKKTETSGPATNEEILKAVKKEDWNDYVVIAKGNHIIHKINGIQTAEVTDNQTGRAKDKGVLALQLHAGPPMTVQFKDIKIKELK
jgi:hypothetical protein